MKVLFTLFRISMGLLSTVFFFFLASLTIIIVYCTDGGALLIILPIAFFAIPAYFRFIKYVFTEKRDEKTKIDEEVQINTRKPV